VKHVQKKGRTSVMIVFDGYDGPTMLKSEELKRRSVAASSADVFFENSTGMHTKTSQTIFLGNPMNKSRLICALSTELQNAGFGVLQSIVDADSRIVSTALDLDRGEQTACCSSWF